MRLEKKELNRNEFVYRGNVVFWLFFNNLTFGESVAANCSSLLKRYEQHV